ncbi:DedA family protein [Emticicia sp. BO119]|uniref:DedA family protein n=1 Tax=Emticicia sp. BO119 TaxID=2757768 RepID=UPI0015F0C688|nr:DedA family protein [Emticicia sp. BO119]MBA4849661.1 DedA family protein [Emticicia sp. BO119]
MEQVNGWLQYLMDSEELIRTGGLVAITLIIFIENGFFFGFFLPGDYLLFLSGVFCGTKILNVPLPLLMICIFMAAIIGSFVGYFSGWYFGDRIQARPDSLFFKKKHIESTRKYFARYGSQTLIIARFLPVVRTFSPILAGIVKMQFYKFTIFNILGGAIWVLTLVGGGFYFGEKFPGIINYVEYIIIFFLAITTFTVIRGYLNAKKELNENKEKNEANLSK